MLKFIIQRNLSVVTVVVTVSLGILISFPVTTFAGKPKVVAVEGVSYNVSASMRDNLKALNGKRVYVTLSSGKIFSGLLKKVGEHLIHLEKIAGKEYFDALIRVEDISAVDTMFRRLQR